MYYREPKLQRPLPEEHREDCKKYGMFGGTGKVKIINKPCYVCSGRGSIEYSYRENPVKCHQCEGTGMIQCVKNGE